MSWTATYYDKQELKGTPLVTRTESDLNLSNDDSLPSEVKDRSDKNTNFSARWTKGINGPGKFKFTATTDDGMRVFVDGEKIIDEWRGQGATTYTAEKQLSAGPHTVKVEYFQGVGGFRAYVNIERIGGQSQSEINSAWMAVANNMRQTQSGLKAAMIYEADDDGNPILGSQYETLHCLFNPQSYKIQKAAQFTIKGLNEKKNYNVSFDKAKIKPRILTIKELWFDTTHTFDRSSGKYKPVSKHTDLLTDFAEVTAGAYVDFAKASTAKAPPPKIAFQWGTFRFLGLIEAVKVKFTLFAPDGTPLRAKVSGLKLREFRHRKAYPVPPYAAAMKNRFKFSSEKIYTVTYGDRLDTIAARMYGDASLWRIIAAHNGVTDPFNIPPGTRLRIPPQ